MGPEAARIMYADAAGARGRGAPLGDSFIQGTGSKEATRERMNWTELRVLKEALSNWREQVKRELALVTMGNATAVAGHPSQLAGLAREIKEREVAFECTVVALRFAGKDNTIADSPSRFSIHFRADRFGPSFVRQRPNTLRADGCRYDVRRYGPQRLARPLPVARAIRLRPGRYLRGGCGGPRVWIPLTW